MELDEQIIYTISKYINLISSQYLITQKNKSMFQPTVNMASNSSQKKRKRIKVRKIRVELNK